MTKQQQMGRLIFALTIKTTDTNLKESARKYNERELKKGKLNFFSLKLRHTRVEV